MELTRETLLERMLTAYGPYYDIQRKQETDAPLVATAVFHEHGVGYVLIRKAEMWSADRHEYVYIYSVPHLTGKVCQRCLEQARKLGMEQIDPQPGHMSSYIVAVFFCDSAEDDAVEMIKKCRVRKSFQFSLRGWMEVHTALVELGKDSVTANPAGRNTAKFLKSVLHPKVKQRLSGLLRK